MLPILHTCVGYPSSLLHLWISLSDWFGMHTDTGSTSVVQSLPFEKQGKWGPRSAHGVWPGCFMFWSWALSSIHSTCILYSRHTHWYSSSVSMEEVDERIISGMAMVLVLERSSVEAVMQKIFQDPGWPGFIYHTLDDHKSVSLLFQEVHVWERRQIGFLLHFLPILTNGTWLYFWFLIYFFISYVSIFN